jgi:hypothetical protein
MNFIDKLEACKAIFTHDTYYLIVSNESTKDIESEVKSNIKDTETVRKKLIKFLKDEIKELQEFKRLYQLK